MPTGSGSSNNGPAISKKDVQTSSPGRKHARKSKAVSAGVGSLNLLVSGQARADTREGARYYDEKDSDACTRFLNAVGAAFDTVSEAPQRRYLHRRRQFLYLQLSARLFRPDLRFKLTAPVLMLAPAE
jgi:hypothetical protein